VLTGPEGPLDEIVAVGGEGRLDLHLHGGAGVESALLDLLTREGWAQRDDQAAQPEPTSLRGARAWASSRWGYLDRLDKMVCRILEGERPHDAAQARFRLQRSLDLALHARRLLTPALVRLVGQPNAGKSTLINALLGDQRALVSPRPGTTRDSVRAMLAVAGVPIVIEDTAGRSESALEHAARRSPAPDLIVHLLLDPREAPLEGPDLLVVQGRADLLTQSGGFAVSGRTGAGLDRLLERMAALLGIQIDESNDIFAPIDPDQLERLGAAFARIAAK
jgi:hypothetical protein